jgi:hypothetical protein
MIGLDVGCLPNTTLNEKYNVVTEAGNQSSLDLTLGYYVIGFGADVDESVLDLTYRFDDRPAYSGTLLNSIPFLSRPINSDISTSEAESLGLYLRTNVVVNDKEYVCYYGKKITSNNMDGSIKKITDIKNGIGRLSIYDTNTPEILQTVNAQPDGTYYVVDSKVVITLQQSDIMEIANSSKLLYGTSKNIREVGLCYGKLSKDPATKRNEVACCQLAYCADLGIDYAIQQIQTDGVFHVELTLGGVNLK